MGVVIYVWCCRENAASGTNYCSHGDDDCFPTQYCVLIEWKNQVYKCCCCTLLVAMLAQTSIAVCRTQHASILTFQRATRSLISCFPSSLKKVPPYIGPLVVTTLSATTFDTSPSNNPPLQRTPDATSGQKRDRGILPGPDPRELQQLRAEAVRLLPVAHQWDRGLTQTS